MKKLFLTFLVIILIWVNINFTYSSTWNNSSNTINYLIKYTDSKLSDINKIIKKYNLEQDKILIKKIKELKEIKAILIQTKKTWEYNNYINKIMVQLKENNNSLKIYIKKQIIVKKDEAKKYTILFSKKIKPILNKINDIVVNIASKLMIKEKINNKDRQIISLLYQIKLKLDKLSSLTNNTFNSKKDLQNYIISNFNQITFHFKQIKNIVRN